MNMEPRNETVTIPRSRYDNLIRKEATLEIIERLYNKAKDYTFRDMVGYLVEDYEE